MSSVLILSDVSKSYGGKPAVAHLDLSVPDDRYVSVLGASGSGKTTLLRLIAGFEEPDTGTITSHGQHIDGTPVYTRGIGFVFQNYALFPHLNVRDNIAFGLINRTDGPLADRKEVDRRVAEAIELVGLAGLERRAVTQVSGGQRQRVALARTLVTRPRLILLDEPLGALDAHLRARMRSELREIRHGLGITFLHVTGSETEALAMGDRVIVLDEGRIGQFDDPKAVYASPATAGVARSLNAYNLLHGTRSADRIITEIGALAFDPAALRSGGGVYAIRRDRITVRQAGAPVQSDEVQVHARFIASEYGGASVNSFFALDNGQIVEVEEHLSLGAVRQLEADNRYELAWRRAAALAYA